ncbi:MAG: Gfo/Idh/MocA family protein [Acidobacteriota bacterium]
MEKKPDYGLAERADAQATVAPELPYRPRSPRSYNPGIGLVGCGGVSEQHLKAYSNAGFRVVALCDRTEAKARSRQRQFFPNAVVTTEYQRVLDRRDVEVVDVTTHPHQRGSILQEALLAGKHVLSQKPLVTDLDFGMRLVDLAKRQGVHLAVNCNGRWAPHFSYIRHAVADGLIGTVLSVHCGVRWDHNWIAGTAFDQVRHIILYDFGIHWFDILTCFVRHPALRVYASLTRSPGQKATPALLGQALIEFDGAQATLSFDGDTRFGPSDRTVVIGDRGTLVSEGPDLMEQRVTLFRQDSYARPQLAGTWFPDGFHGTMGELLCAIEEGRQPLNDARSHLQSLELCFAAVASAEDHLPHVPGSIRKLPG